MLLTKAFILILRYCDFSDRKSEERCGTSKGFLTISPPGRRIATVLFLLETSIPTAFIFIKTSLPVSKIAIGQIQLYSLPIQSTVAWRECTYGDSTCIKRTLRMRSWLSVLIADARSKKRDDIPIAPSLYSLSNKMDKSLLAVRDINHKYIVVEKSCTKKYR